MVGGRVVQRGPHAELLAVDGWYRSAHGRAQRIRRCPSPSPGADRLVCPGRRTGSRRGAGAPPAADDRIPRATAHPPSRGTDHPRRAARRRAGRLHERAAGGPGPDAPTGHWRWTRRPTGCSWASPTPVRASTRTTPTAPATAGSRSSNGAVWQNHHLMGFGTLNPEPAPGEYDWESLDRRMRLTEDTGARTVLTLCCAPDWMKGGTPARRLVAARGRPAARSLRRLRRARRCCRAAVSAGRAGAGVERAEGFLPHRPQPLGPGGLHRALQRGVPRGQSREPGRQGGRAVRRAQQPRRRPAARLGPARAVGGGRLPRARRRRPLARAQGRRRLRRRRRQHQDPRGHPAGEPTSGPASTPPSTGGCAPARTCRSGGPSSTRTCPTASRPARRARRAPPVDAGGGGRVRGDRRAGGAAGGARRPTRSPTPPCGPTAPSPAAAARRR